MDVVKAEHEQLLKEAFERAKVRVPYSWVLPVRYLSDSQSEAGVIHSQELQSLRVQSDSARDQLLAGHQTTLDNLKAEYENNLRSKVSALEKQISSQALELRATQDDLAKAKSNYATTSQDLENTTSQLEEAQRVIASLDKSDKDETINKLSRDLSNLQDEHAALTDMFTATKDSLREITNNHVTELEEAAKSRVQEVTKLKASYDEQVAQLNNEKTTLSTTLSDLQGEVATLKASLVSDPLMSPRSNGTAHAAPPSVSEEDLKRMHEAHNLKLYDLQAVHDKELRAMKEELENALAKADDLNHQLERKTMEIQYLEQDQEDSQDQITRYVKIFGIKSFLGGVVTLAVIYGIF